MLRLGLPTVSHSRLAAHPVHSMGSPSLPRPRFTLPMRSGAGFSHLLAIAYDYNVLGLGPDSPWGDWRCPGTLRLAVWMVLTSMTLLIPAFALVCAPPVLAIGLRRGTQRSPTKPLGTRGFHSFGSMLEPRYVVGARTLDQ